MANAHGAAITDAAIKEDGSIWAAQKILSSELYNFFAIVQVIAIQLLKTDGTKWAGLSIFRNYCSGNFIHDCHYSLHRNVLITKNILQLL